MKIAVPGSGISVLGAAHFLSKKHKVRFDDWIFQQDVEVAINRAIVTKFGIKVGE